MIQDEGWKLDRTNYYQEGWLATGNARGLVGVTFTTSHCRTRATELPLRANYNLRGHRSEASLFSLSLSLSHICVFTIPFPRFYQACHEASEHHLIFRPLSSQAVNKRSSFQFVSSSWRTAIEFCLNLLKKVSSASSIPLLRFGPSNFSGRVVGQIGGLSSLFRRGSFRENTANFYTANTCDYVRDENWIFRLSKLRQRIFPLFLSLFSFLPHYMYIHIYIKLFIRSF